jgi:hypothetical protein
LLMVLVHSHLASLFLGSGESDRHGGEHVEQNWSPCVGQKKRESRGRKGPETRCTPSSDLLPPTKPHLLPFTTYQ